MSETPQSSPSAASELPKAYRPADHEPRIWERWEREKVFHADPARVLRGEARPYSMVIPPPNVTAALHLGHALNNSLQDILVRAHRMMGFETLWMPGTDHAGIATQAVVEKRVSKEEKKRRTDFTREEFVKKIQLFKDEYEATITNQLKKMGCSCDWERQRFTMDEVCARAVREAFFRLFKDGLIYRGKRLVNWDPVLQTAVADDECYDEEIDGAFYYLRYPLVRRSDEGREPKSSSSSHSVTPSLRHSVTSPITWNELARLGYPGAETNPGEEQAWVTVATTRPETYLGDTAVGVNPYDPRANALRGLFVELPLVGRIIPIIEDFYVVLPAALARTEEERNDPKAGMATGFLKVTPAHDPNDYEIGRRHSVNGAMAEWQESPGSPVLINIFAPDGRISDKHGWTDAGDAHRLVGKKREEARKLVVEEFKSRGGLEKTTPHRHSVKHSDRSKAIIEPYLSDQWYVRVTDPRMAQAASAALVPDQRSFTSSSSSSSSSFPPAQSSGAGVPPASTEAPVTSSSHSATPITRKLQTHQRRLPHWQIGGQSYFITFRVAKGELSSKERQIVLNACRHWDGERLELHAAVVMPDHVHLVLSPFEKSPAEWHPLPEIMHSIKRFAAGEINKARGTAGQVWQDESFDRVIREGEFDEKVAYIQKNPVRKGLVKEWQDYPFTWVPDATRRHETRFPQRWRGAGNGEQVGGRWDTCPTSSGREEGAGEGTGADSGDGSMRFYPARYSKTFEQWHDGIRDWCISRQLWWGHRIPVWTTRLTLTPADFGSKLCSATDDIFGHTDAPGRVHCRIVRLADNQAFEIPLRPIGHAQYMSRYETPAWFTQELEGEYELQIATNDVAWCEWFFSEEFPVRQDPDVLDTWFSSALWPMSTMGWPDAAQAAKDTGIADFPDLLPAFNPTTTLCTAREIITLWVSRMTMFNRYFMPPRDEPRASASGSSSSQANPLAHARGSFEAMGRGHGPVPFHNVFVHSVIQDGEGRKMSKSLGNGVDPLDIIATHGADAMRFTLCHMTTQTQDVRMPVVKDQSGRNTSPKFDFGRNFCNKLWNAARYAIGILSQDTSSLRHSVTPSLSLADRWMLSRLAAAVDAATNSLAEFQFSDYAQTLYDILWRDFCDWYLEAIKPTVATDPNQRAVLRAALDTILRLLHPIAPFVTEAIFEKLAELPAPAVPGLELSPPRKGGTIATAGWPVASKSLRDENAEIGFERLRGLITAIREVRAQHKVAQKRRILLHAPAALNSIVELGGRGPSNMVLTLAELERITHEAPTGDAVSFRFESHELKVSNLADAVDAGTERARLEKIIADGEKSAATLAARLANPGYADKAPPHMVQQTKDQLAKARADVDAARKALEELV